MVYLSLQNPASSSKVTIMRYAELSFLVLLVIYHTFLLVPRHRRFFAGNYLIFLAGMALAWNLGLEGLRWQTVPPLVLFAIDLAVLFPSFANLRGRLPRPSFWSVVGQGVRFLVSSMGFLWALAAIALALAFPLPQVELTGGLNPAFRTLLFPASQGQPALRLSLWYPASGSSAPVSRPQSDPARWSQIESAGGPPALWNSYLMSLPSSLIEGGALASPGTRYPVIFVSVPENDDPLDFGYALEDLASRGFVVASAQTDLGNSPAPPWTLEGWIESAKQAWTASQRWLEPELTRSKPARTNFELLESARLALRQLDDQPGDPLFHGIDWNKVGVWAWGRGDGPREAQLDAIDAKALVHTGDSPKVGLRSPIPQLWIVQGSPEPGLEGRWYLALPLLTRADWSDSAYLRPYLAFFGLKSHLDSGNHGALRQYVAGFFQYSLWKIGASAPFDQTVPQVPGLTLTGR